MEVFDETIKSLTENGIMVVLNNHMSNAGWCCSLDDGNGLWFNPDYPEEKWIDILEKMTSRYEDNPMVVGNDLRNELREDHKNGKIPTWGTGLKTDWRKAATKAGNAIHAINPTQLILVEGL